MVSGIGPSATLEQLDIPIISKSEGVGQGVWVRDILVGLCSLPIRSNYLLL